MAYLVCKQKCWWKSDKRWNATGSLISTVNLIWSELINLLEEKAQGIAKIEMVHLWINELTIFHGSHFIIFLVETTNTVTLRYACGMLEAKHCSKWTDLKAEWKTCFERGAKCDNHSKGDKDGQSFLKSIHSVSLIFSKPEKWKLCSCE